MMEIYFDGACEPCNPGGVATIGYVIRRGAEPLLVGRGVASTGAGSTNNVAEYRALIKALEEGIKLAIPDETVTVRGDSQLVIRQLEGRYAVNAAFLKPLYAQAVEVLRKTTNPIKLEWIPREQNTDADWQSKQAVREAFITDPNLFKKIVLPNGKYIGKSLADVDEGYYRWLWTRNGIPVQDIPSRPA